jgi:hypothetical protein
MRRDLFFILAFSVMLTVFAHGDEEASQHLQRGIQLLDELFIDEAISELETALSLGLSSQEEKVRCYSHLAKAYITRGEDGKAVGCFLSLLRIRRGYRPINVSPKVMAIFEKARGQADLNPPRIQHEPPKSARVGDRVKIEAKVADEGRIASVTLTFQMPGDESRTVRMSPSKGRFIYELPKLTTPGLLRYSIVARDDWGNESVPISGSIEVMVKGSKGLWRWVGLGASALIAGVGGIVYYLLMPEEEPVPSKPTWPGSFPPPPE